VRELASEAQTELRISDAPEVMKRMRRRNAARVSTAQAPIVWTCCGPCSPIIPAVAPES